MELLDSNEKLVEAQNQLAKLQMSLDNIMKDKVLGHCDFLSVFCSPDCVLLCFSGKRTNY